MVGCPTFFGSVQLSRLHEPPFGVTLIPFIGLNDWKITFNEDMEAPPGIPLTDNFIVLINGSPPIPYAWTAWTQVAPNELVIEAAWTDPSVPGDLWSIEQITPDASIKSAVTGLVADTWGPITYLNEA